MKATEEAAKDEEGKGRRGGEPRKKREVSPDSPDKQEIEHRLTGAVSRATPQ